MGNEFVVHPNGGHGPSRRAGVVVAAGLAVAGLLAAPALAEEGTAASPRLVTQYQAPGPTPSPTSSPTPPPPPGPDGGHAEPDHPSPLSGDLLDAQIQQADRISALLERSTSEVAVAMRRMDELSDRTNAVLETLAQAEDTERASRQEAAAARADLARLEGRLAIARAVVRDWVFDVYSGGGEDVGVAGVFEAMSSDAGDAGNPLGDLTYLTDQRTRALEEVRVLTAEQVRLTAAAQEAEVTATQARARVERSTAALEQLMTLQRARIGELRRLQMAEVGKAGPVAGVLIGARTPRAQEAARRLRAALRAAVAETADIGEPCTDDTGTHPNGSVPSRALCPVWGAPGQRLSPAAAASFSALSTAYAAQTGTALCVTDSYRSLSEQVALKASRGRFAAMPGTSRHGLGRAVDLCGGVEDFGSAVHLWMRQNAPLYGWFHPAWAEADGPLPEPWHWEFAG